MVKICTFSILFIKGGFGEYAEDSVSALGSRDVTRISHTLYGHADSFLEVNHRQNIDKTILQWLLTHANH